MSVHDRDRISDRTAVELERRSGPFRTFSVLMWTDFLDLFSHLFIVCAFAIYRTVTCLPDWQYTQDCLMASRVWRFCLAMREVSLGFSHFNFNLWWPIWTIANKNIETRRSGEESGREWIRYWIIETKVMTRLKVKVNNVVLRCVAWFSGSCYYVCHRTRELDCWDERNEKSKINECERWGHK